MLLKEYLTLNLCFLPMQDFIKHKIMPNSIIDHTSVSHVKNIYLFRFFVAEYVRMD